MNQSKKNHFLQSLSKNLIAFIISFLLFLLSLVVILQLTVMRDKFMIGQIDRTGYTEKVATELQADVDNLGMGSGIPKGVLTSLVDKAELDKQIKNAVTRAYTGIGTEITTSEIEDKADKLINDYVNEKDLKLTAKSKTAIERFESTVADRYMDIIQFPYMVQIGELVQQYRRYAFLADGILTILIVFFAVLLAKILYFKHRYTRYGAYIMTGTGLMVLILPLIIFLSNIVDRLGLSTQSFYLFATGYLKGILLYFMVCGGIFIGMGIICIIISETRRHHIT